MKIKHVYAKDYYQKFTETFPSEIAEKIFKEFKIGQEDTIREKVNGGYKHTIFNKRERLAVEIISAYMREKPTILDDPEIHISKQKEKLAALKESTATFRGRLEDNFPMLTEKCSEDALNRTISQNELYNRVVVPAQSLEKDNTITQSFYTRAKKLLMELEWLESCFGEAPRWILENNNPEGDKDKKKGKKINKYEYNFFISLCNIFYKYKQEIPHLSTDERKIYYGNILQFLELCYKGFGILYKEVTFYNQIKNINKKPFIEKHRLIPPGWK